MAKKTQNHSKTTKSTKVVYTWGDGKADGNGTMKALLGGKGANLAEMTRIGLPVPPGFTITTDVCTHYYANKRTYPSNLQAQMEAGVHNMEKIMGTKFGATQGMPLLVAVRSGARDSMPGMMDTILNLGLNDQSVVALEKATNNPRFAWDCYRRFIQMYGDVVLGVQKREGEDHEPFETVIEEFKHEKYDGDVEDSALTAGDQQELVKRFKALVKERTGRVFPNDPWDQLRGAAGAVFSSWMNDRAIVYRRKYNIPAEWGTAVNVQAMVFGNTGDKSGSGVAFTRNPANGVDEFYGEFLINAQGEDVVAGVRTPEPVSKLKAVMPESFAQLMKVRQTLEKHFKDVQDIEFTVQEGKLYMLQTRNGKRTAAAALKFAADMVQEKLIDWETAVMRKIAAEGILTARGGVSSHAALVARQMGKVCVCGAAAVQIDYDKKTTTIAGHTFKEGDYLSIDGTAGTVYAGQIKTAPSEIVAGLLNGDKAAQKTEKYKNYVQLMKWCSQATRLAVRTNADNPEQTAQALAFGAQGIGLTRTEHMFFEGDRIDAVREMILAETLEGRKKALAKIPRVRAARREVPGRPREEARHQDREGRRPRRRPARVQPDARPPRLPPRHRLPGDHRDPGPRHLRSRRRGPEEGHQGQARGHGPARRLQARARPPGRGHPPRRRRGPEGTEVQDRLLRGHDDRSSPRRPHGRRDRPHRRVLQLRHERPHPDRPRRQPRRHG